jgi:hypothetical protein
LVLVVLISVWVGYRSQKSTKYRASIHSAPVVLVLVLVFLVPVWTAKDVPEVEPELTLGESQAAGKEN